MSLLAAIKSNVSHVFRRMYIKRRNLVTGLYEEDWVEVSSDVKTYGKVRQEIDSVRLNEFAFANMKIVMENDSGRYNPHDSDFSLWYGFLNQQRTLVKVEAGFIQRRQRDDGFWINREFQAATRWDEDYWDESGALWDYNEPPIVFTGIIAGDIPISDKNEVAFTVRPLTSVFEEFPARNLTGWTSTGMTASEFITMVRDQTDGAGSFIFRPFFGDTTTGFDFSTTSVVYSNLNTSTAEYVYDSTVWEIIKKLAEAENFVPYITPDGIFKFVSRTGTVGVQFEFHGAGSFDTTYGHTIKEVTALGPKLSKYHSRIQVKFKDTTTSDSVAVVESAYSVSPSSNPYVLGVKTLEIENFFIPNTTTATTIAQQVFNDYSALKKEVTFKTSFIPHLKILDRCSITYDPTEPSANSLWDQNNWADTAGAAGSDQDLVWDSQRGEAMILRGQEFKFLSQELDLDNLECTFIAREV